MLSGSHAGSAVVINLWRSGGWFASWRKYHQARVCCSDSHEKLGDDGHWSAVIAMLVIMKYVLVWLQSSSISIWRNSHIVGQPCPFSLKHIEVWVLIDFTWNSEGTPVTDQPPYAHVHQSLAKIQRNWGTWRSKLVTCISHWVTWLNDLLSA